MSVYKIKRKIDSSTTEDIQLDYNTAIANKPTIPTSINGLSGGKLTSPLQISGGDAVTAPKIALDHTASGQITDESTSTLFGFLSNNATTLTVGGSGYALNLRGSGTRPQYKGNDLALYSDVPTTYVSSVNGSSGAITNVVKNASAAYAGTDLWLAGYTGNSNEITSINVKGSDLAKTTDLNSYLAKSGGTMTGDIDWSSSNTSAWLKPYLLAFKNANTSASPTYPYTGFYQWGDEWQVNARDSSNTFVHNLLTINNTTKVATFSARPTVNGTNVALTSDGYATVQVYNSEADALAASQADANKICLF